MADGENGYRKESKPSRNRCFVVFEGLLGVAGYLVEVGYVGNIVREVELEARLPLSLQREQGHQEQDDGSVKSFHTLLVF